MLWSKLLLILLLVGSGMCPPLFAAPPSRVRSLIAVDSVQVVVEDLNRMAQQTGLQKEQIQHFAEQYLVKQDIKVVRGAKNTPIMYVRLSSVIGGTDAHAPVSFYLTVQVKQFAHLARTQQMTSSNPVAENTPLLVTTWEDGTMVMSDRKELQFYVQQVLSNMLGSFMQDYQTANGKGETL